MCWKVWWGMEFSDFTGTFVYFFLKTFIKTRLLKVILFWELSQQTDILVVFVFKVYKKSAVFRFFYSIYTFLFRDLIRTRFFTIVFKDLMRTGVLRVFSFVFSFSLKDFMGNKNFIRFSYQRFYEIQSFYSFLVHLYFSFQRFWKGYPWYFKVCWFYFVIGKDFFKY